MLDINPITYAIVFTQAHERQRTMQKLTTNKRKNTYHITINQPSLTLCDPSNPTQGVEINLAAGPWTITPRWVETSGGDFLSGWEMHPTNTTPTEYSRRYYLDTDTGVLALVEPGYRWDGTQAAVACTTDVVASGDTWLALRTREAGMFRVTVGFNQVGEAVSLKL